MLTGSVALVGSFVFSAHAFTYFSYYESIMVFLAVGISVPTAFMLDLDYTI